jgi:hypothetical protein
MREGVGLKPDDSQDTLVLPVKTFPVQLSQAIALVLDPRQIPAEVRAARLNVTSTPRPTNRSFLFLTKERGDRLMLASTTPIWARLSLLMVLS